MDIFLVARNSQHHITALYLKGNNALKFLKYNIPPITKTNTFPPSPFSMTRAPSNIIMEALSIIPKLHGIDESHKRAATILRIRAKKPEELEQQPSQTTRRRLAISLAPLVLFGTIGGIGTSLAEDNGFWLTSPIPIPTVKNKIVNEDTGTRSFIKNGIFIANIGTKGRMLRLKKSAFDLIALGNLIGEDTLNYVKRYLRMKSTMMYYDFDEVITAAANDDKPPLIDLANRLFDNMEKFDGAVKRQNLSMVKTCYQDSIPILKEVIAKMPTRFTSVVIQDN